MGGIKNTQHNVIYNYKSRITSSFNMMADPRWIYRTCLLMMDKEVFFMASWFFQNYFISNWISHRVHMRLLTCWSNKSVHFVNHPSQWVTLGVAVLVFSFLWVYGFVHLIKQIQLFCHFVDTFFVWPRIPFVVATPQVDLNVEQPANKC